MRDLEAELFRQEHWQGELSHTRRDGRRIVVNSRWVLQRDKDGNPGAILEIDRDITGQKQAEAAHAWLPRGMWNNSTSPGPIKPEAAGRWVRHPVG